ncbi:hypothetical protein PybrP1_010641 [[Pythium] brassicae (nom. inval.)]|nr:hypothetical protein PybrP1_010641 [[Pythium] brassicae (nom. inval.)]
MEARDRRMDIAALCEPASGGDDGAVDLEVRAQLRQITHQVRPLHRVEQDRILGYHQWRGNEDNAPTHAPRLPPLLSRANHLADSRIAVLSAVALVRSAQAPPPSLTTVSSSSSGAPSSRLLLPPIAPPPTTMTTMLSTKLLALKPPVAPSKKRARRMTNSERGKLYRSRRKSYVETLEGEVQELQQEMQGLQLYGGLLQDMALQAPHVSGGAYSRVVSEYFTVFAAGMPVDPAESAELARVRPTPRQAVFVSTLLDARMEFCGDGGPSRLLGNWKAFSLYHSSLRYTLRHLQVVLQEPSAVVTADAVLTVRLTRATVEHMFPHVLWNAALVQRLVGLEVEYHVHNVFYFGESGKVVRYESHMDFLAAFMAALGNLADAVELAGPISERQQREQFTDGSKRGDGGASVATNRSSTSSSSTVTEDPEATE